MESPKITRVPSRDPKIDEILEDTSAYFARVDVTRKDQAKAWLREEMDRLLRERTPERRKLSDVVKSMFKPRN
ncbi:hypothetical protein QFZ24_006089 [Streptomyces phaeochromogenes]|uniref:hypothetical protein n=1 Tax=Streptomyces phaeochromogenes TaxID=1923 RepID=UPI0027911377|nr:hypothetical protein [Streptomyces phaeochromogenes]MDQ0952166.1 hypothetical protein [Streptomyces phaeochromogenes]